MPPDLIRLLRVLKMFGIDVPGFVQHFASDRLTAAMESGKKAVGKRARTEHYVPANLAADPAEQAKLVSWSTYWLIREALPKVPGMSLAADWLRDTMRGAVVAEVAPQVTADLKEGAFLDLLMASIVRHLPDLSKLIGT